jgi:hypothetical protein
MRNIIFTAVLAAGLSAFAAGEGAGKPEGNHPCKPIREACKAAGFEKGKHKEGKGLMKDCMAKILNGEQVAGVTANAADVDACKAKQAEHKGKGMHK